MAGVHRHGPNGGRRLAHTLAGAASLAVALAGSSLLLADVAPPSPKPVRPSCGLARSIERVDAASKPSPSIEAFAQTAASVGRASPRLVYRGLSGAGTRRATVTFDFMVCGDPRRAGGPIGVQARATWPAGVAPASVRFVTVRGAANAVTVPF